MSFPGQPIIVDEFTRRLLGLLSRKHGTSYGQIVELLVLEEVLREALRDNGEAAVPVSADVWEKIRERLG